MATAPICVTYEDDSAVPLVQTGGRIPPSTATVPTTARTPAGLPLADQVYVPPGRAALVEVLPSSQAPNGTLILATDQGRAYPLAGREVAAILGYPQARPIRLPAGLATRIPMGAALDPSTALISPGQGG